MVERDANPMTVWVTSDAMKRGVRVVLTVPHPYHTLAGKGWRQGVNVKPGSGLYAIHPEDWHRTEVGALAKVKKMLATYRRKLKREHEREMARIDGIAAALKLGRLPMAKEGR